MENTNYYEPRYVSQSVDNSTNWFGQERTDKTLGDVVFEHDKIVLLGNPGSGKTKELQMLFENLWIEKENTGIIPFSINLKNFRKINKFEDLILFPEWKLLPSLIFILDGLDEIAETQDFISAFELFISQNKQLKIKYVLSCRTNIYEKYLVNISDFESFYLQDLSFEQSSSLLSNKYGVDIKNYQYSEKHSNYLKTPFFLDLFASYVIEKKSLPISDSVMWELFINKTLEKHKEKLSKKELINKLKIVTNLHKVAFTNELMQQNFSSAEELNEITGNYLEYIDNPFTIELAGEPKRWNFTHRQIQEYLVATTLAEKDFEELLQIIKVPNIDVEVIHPSLFNTVTFLINVLDKDSEKFRQLIDWLINNQIEILFKADSDRTALFKEHVFQDYFNSQCLVKKLWISTNRTFSVKEIAEFGDCEANFDFLLEFLSRQENHFRVIISSLNLLGFFKPTFKRAEKLKPLFIELLNSAEVAVNIKSEIIHCITNLKFCETDQKYLDEILYIFREESNKEINAALLFLIYFINDVDRLFWYIETEFLRNAKIIKRNDDDDVHRGNDWKLEEIILKFRESDNFIKLISYYFFDKQIVDLSNHYELKIQEKCLYFSQNEPDFIVRFLKSINKKTNYYQQDKLLLSLIIDANKEIDAAEYLIKNNDFSEVRSFVSRFSNSKILNIVLECFKKGHIKLEDIIYFRNNLSHHNIATAIEFEKIMTASGFVFESNLKDENEFELERQEANKKIQDNFDMLFDKEILLKIIEKTYKQNNFEILNIDNIYKLGSNWRQKNNYPVYFDNSLAILQSLIERFGSLTYIQVSDFLNSKIFLLKLIFENVKNNNRERFKFNVSEEQKKEIIDWCIITSQKINFSNIIEIQKDNSFIYKKDFETLKLILAFQEHFKFSLSKDFLLNCLEFYEIDNFSEKEDFFAYLFNEINDKVLFDKKVVENLLTKQLLKFILDKHVDYALNNNLTKAYFKIREYFLNQKPGYNLDSKLEMYLNKTEDIDLLKECCSDINSPICWSAVKLLALEGEEVFCINKAIEYLNQEETERKEYFISNAMWVLFHFNNGKAIEYYLSMKYFDFYSINFSDYSVIEDFTILETLFNKIYLENRDKPDFSHGSSFYDAYISNLSKKDNGSYIKTQKILNSIKEKLLAEKSDTRLFSINLLIDYSKNSYINSKSVPLTFKEALNKVHAIIK